MNPGVLPSNPFIAGGMLENPRLFIGRKYELDALLSRMTGAQPTSINIYGDKRIGKSSLLYHFFQTWETRVADSSRYVVVYLSLLPQLLDISQDVQAAISASSVSRKYELREHPIQALQNLRNSLTYSKNSGIATTFGNIIQTWLGILETAQRNGSKTGTILHRNTPSLHCW